MRVAMPVAVPMPLVRMYMRVRNHRFVFYFDAFPGAASPAFVLLDG